MWLTFGLLNNVCGWPWQTLVAGERFDLLAVDWRDMPIVYVETKTPTAPLRKEHRAEIETRLLKWGTLRHVFLTNGWSWERFDAPFGSRLSAPAMTYRTEEGPDACGRFLEPLVADHYLP
jgi:hypothetical protein